MAGWLSDEVLSSLPDPEEEERGGDLAVFFEAADFLLRTEREGGRVVKAVEVGLVCLGVPSLPLSLELSDSNSRHGSFRTL